MTSAPPSNKAPRRDPHTLFLLAGAFVAAASIAAIFKTLDGPLQLIVAAGVGASVDVLIKDSKHAGDWSHLAIVALSIALGFFATWTVILLHASGKTAASVQPHVQILSPAAGVAVGEKFSDVNGLASDLPQGDTIWLMSQTVGETRSYLMGEPCAIKPSGHWTCPPVYFGTSKPNYQRYNILVRLLDGKTQQHAIEEWGNVRGEGKNALSYPEPIGKSSGSIEVHRYGPP